ncbi:uncharacterized protein GGS22DRAFT_14782 [Annulohypoxylon maeteangense]|uniref:uncharacterized protein n=1 Tax=Annulohypoxylon maeteangense TaxID=1927788 RepID=UPI0020087B71|nr:uncharacterized protein GGS22DRAFT_14782 [Annulohypoxylon maeteangense]KAI0890536.1 hypothetical protein GGS22DRAFT_14782 [Annulohypoxylon maeteangense]
MNTQSLRMSERSRREMRQKNHFHDPFFGLKGLDPRPTSVATEIVDTEWEEEEEDIVSEIEDEDPDSPRISLNSSGQPSVTTLSSYEEAQTPRSSRAREVYPFGFDSSKPVEGPRGPHLFRASTASSFNSFEYQSTLTLSPITPKTARPFEADHRFPLTYEPPPPRSRNSPFQFTHEKLAPVELSLWSPEKVAQWMLNAGIEIPVAEKFVENDINGAILITLKFEDLKELSIQSFGVRTKVWEEIHVLRDSKAAAEAAAASPRPDTPIEDEEAKEVRRERRRERKEEGNSVPRSESVKRSKSKKKPAHEDIISPLESVSIVGIEQMMPKPHHCSKGENCSKFRRQQRMIEAFKQDHPFVDVDQGGIIMVAGDPGNPETAPAINRPSSTEALRPMSDAVPSVIASSDVLGPGMPPFQYLQEAALRNLQTRDPQDNVRQFLNFQHQHGDECSSTEVPPTPPFEVPAIGTATTTPTPRTPHEGLRALPKLAIPGQQPQLQQQLQAQRHSQQLRSANQTPQPSFYPQRMDRGEALSPDLHNAPYRFGTPFSDMDVPLTAVPLGPVARDASQSVPPDMNYRTAPLISRSQSRASRRPSFQVMAPVEEDAAATPVARVYGHRYTHSVSPKTSSAPKIPSRSQPLQAPPRPQYPWSPPSTRTGFGPITTPGQPTPSTVKDAEGVTYAGPVKKRKTRMLRHEWHDHYATLKGTRLALHKDAEARSRALEYIDIDDYAIACSSLSTGSKLNAAFKAMSISRSAKNGASAADPDSVAAFSFQLIPQNEVGRGALGGRLRKRESQSVGGAGGLPSPPPGIEGAANGTGKTHHFAVRSRDERIDWMRELMLAKALRQKGEGFEVSVNGNMI